MIQNMFAGTVLAAAGFFVAGGGGISYRYSFFPFVAAEELRKKKGAVPKGGIVENENKKTKKGEKKIRLMLVFGF